MAERAREHYYPVWVSGTNRGDVLYLPSATSLETYQVAPCARQAEMRLPDLLPVQLPREDMEFFPRVSLQAILVLDSPDVDIRLWNATVAEMEASGKLWSPLRTFRWLCLYGCPDLADELFHA